ncbi:hypothetical protein ES703_112294 [subsurface metagenome]
MKGKQQAQVQHTSKKKEESLSFSIEVRDKKGRVLRRISAPSRSYVEQWNQAVNIKASAATKSVRDTDGVERASIENSAQIFGANAVIGETRIGIRVGKGATAVVIDNYALETPCDEGTDTDEFNHQAVTFTEPLVVGSTCSFTVKRIMVNNSGATISGIREIGCYFWLRVTGSYFFLGFRDILPSAVYVPNGGSITVIYTIAVTV